MKFIKQALNDSLIYSLGMFLVRLCSFLLTAIYVRVFSASAFSFLALVMVLLPLSRSVASLEVWQSAVILASRDRAKSSQYYYYGFLFVGLSTSLIMLIAMAMLLSFGSVEKATVMWLYFALLVDALFGYLLSLLRWESCTGWHIAMNFGSALVESISILILLLYFDCGINSVFVSWFIVKGATVIIFLLKQRFFAAHSIEFKVLRRMLAYSWPLAVNNLPVTLYLVVDRSILGMMRPVEDVAIFSVGMTFAGIVGIAMGGVSTALSPLIYRQASQDNVGNDIARLFEWIVGLCLLLPALFMLFNNDAIALILPPNYANFYVDKPWISIMMLSNIMLYLPVFSPGFYLKNKTYLTPVISTLGLGLNIAVTSLLCYHYGIYGVIWGALIANSVMALLYIFWSQYFYAIPFVLWRLLRITALCLLCFGFGFALNWHTEPWHLSMSLFKIALLAMTVLVVLHLYLGRVVAHS